MAGHEVAQQTVVELAGRLRKLELSPVELTRAYLDRIQRLDGKLRAYIAVCGEGALEEARRAEQELAQGRDRGPLHGIPVAVKDQLDAKGVVTTGGSTILEDVAMRDSTVVARLREAGAVLLGKLNLAEFAMGGTVRHPFGDPRNPWNTDHQPGHSSSGSGVAVAASLCAAAIGEDTGGSIRIPAAWCGVTGLRPTWGRVSRYGMLGLCWSMDQAGPMAWTVEDTAIVFEAIGGHDPNDAHTSRQPVPRFQPRDSLKGTRVGVVRESLENPLLDAEVRAAVEKAMEALREAGAEIREVSMPLYPSAGVISATITDAEGAYVHRHLLRTRASEYDVASRRRLLAASLIPARLYQKAQKLRVLVRRQVLSALEEADVLVTPTQPSPAPPLERETGLNSKDDVLKKFYGPRGGTGPFNLAAVPAMSVPCGFSRSGLPIGMQLVGRPFGELTLFQVGHAYQQRTDWHTQRPSLEA